MIIIVELLIFWSTYDIILLCRYCIYLESDKMNKVNAFRMKIVAQLVLAFSLSNLVICFIIKLLENAHIISLFPNIDFMVCLVYLIVVAIFSFIVFLFLAKILFDKNGLRNDNVLVLKFLTHDIKLDVMTGLFNKEGLKEKVNELISRSPDKVGAMLFIDIDNIKFINDKYGHKVGDNFILKLSEILRYFDQYNGLLSRISGDEFIVYLHGFDTETELYKIIKKLYNYSEDYKVKTPDGVENKVRFSSGLAYYPSNAQSFDDLYKYSDFALYSAKHNEKGTVIEFDVHDYNQNYYMLENSFAINQLLDSGLIRFAYQPIVDLKTGEIFAYEALMRSKMENFKSPLEIINVAKMQSKLPQLETLVVFSVYEDMMKNEDKLGDCKIFINSLPSQVLDFDNASELARRYSRFFNKVVVEITEQENINKDNLKIKTDFINNFGIGLAIDDYGSGFSNEKRILALNPEIVKIDMDLIQEISTDKDKQTIVKNIVNFCHDKGMKLVAEGVEDSEDLHYIIGLGIDYVQGYYLAKPNFEILQIPDNIKQEIIDCNKLLK